jgi:hypothetical protein
MRTYFDHEKLDVYQLELRFITRVRRWRRPFPSAAIDQLSQHENDPQEQLLAVIDLWRTAEALRH